LGFGVAIVGDQVLEDGFCVMADEPGGEVHGIQATTDVAGCAGVGWICGCACRGCGFLGPDSRWPFVGMSSDTTSNAGKSFPVVLIAVAEGLSIGKAVPGVQIEETSARRGARLRADWSVIPLGHSREAIAAADS
jgi:hypothetical protein